MNPITSLLRFFRQINCLPSRQLKSWLRVESLEDRSQPAALAPSIDGTGHNLLHPDWGSTMESMLRKTPAAYDDGISAPGGVGRANPRDISNALAAQPEDTPMNDRDMSAFIYAWGQFIDHDLDLTMSANPRESFNIPIPLGDAFFDPLGTGTQVMPLARSQYDGATGTSPANPRQQVNSITAWIDASMVYGSDETTAAKLREFVGGRMKMGDGGLLPIDPETGQVIAGDIRAAENPELTSLHALFLREHNRIAGEISAADASLSDEEIYQKARMRVIGEIQSITYNEFLPALLGPNAPRAYRGYNQNVNPGISNEFAAAAFRVGHTLVGEDIEFLDNNGNPVHDPLTLREAFFNTAILNETGIDPVLKYLASDLANEVDTKVIDDLRNFLFGPPGSGGLDLASLNIQRGRDHGLGSYNATRAAFGLPRVRSFAQITSNRELQQALKDLYGSVDNIDLWVGGLAEDHLRGSSVGATFSRIIADQFARVRDGDRFWFQNVFTGAERRSIEQTTLASVIRRNTAVTNLQDNVFFFRPAISGQVFADLNRDGVRGRGEQGVGRRTVELLGEDGIVLATAETRPDGSWRFDRLELGTYRVREVLPPGRVSTTGPEIEIRVTRGDEIGRVQLGEAPQLPAPPAGTRPPSVLDVVIGTGINGPDGNTMLPRRPGSPPPRT
jgi:hypothetical protein